MIGDVDPRARPGDLVAVHDKGQAPFGVALYNPRSVITLRLLTRDLDGFDVESFFADRLGRAARLRRDVLRLDRVIDAYRVVNDFGDGLPALVVDRYGDWFVLEFYALGMHAQADRIERLLAGLHPGAQFARRASEYTAKMEGFDVPAPARAEAPAAARSGRVRIREHGVQFDVDLSAGHKTGFFCDQRENRQAAAALASDRRVLDVCCYTGGFGLHASVTGGAREVTCVDLDPDACELARRNAHVNGARIRVVCADAFPYLRQMAANRERFGLVVLDPHKLIASREGYRLGRQKYVDLNRLALGVLDSDGLLVTCSCSGMLPWDDFERAVRTAAAASGRRLQVLRKSGAGPDHPVAIDHPEGEYLKVLWCRAD
jgi:23S rRNA (cytosine1962-C5)-methyltransferase